MPERNVTRFGRQDDTAAAAEPEEEEFVFEGEDGQPK